MSLIYIFLKDTPHWRLKLLLDLVILRNLEGAYPSWLKRESGRFRVQELCSHKSLNILLQVFVKYVNVHDLIKSDDRESQKIRLGNFSAEKLSLRFHKSHKSKEVCFLKQKKTPNRCFFCFTICDPTETASTLIDPYRISGMLRMQNLCEPQ